jgi:hypothetical protein
MGPHSLMVVQLVGVCFATCIFVLLWRYGLVSPSSKLNAAVSRATPPSAVVLTGRDNDELELHAI